MLVDDPQVLDLFGQTWDFTTAAESGLVRGKAPLGQAPMSCSDPDPMTYSSFHQSAPVNDATTIFDAGSIPSDAPVTADPTLTQGHLLSHFDNTLNNLHGPSGAVHSEPGLDSDIGFPGSQSNPTTILPMGRFDVDTHGNRIGETVMLGASPSLNVVESEETTSISYRPQAQMSLPYLQNTPIDVFPGELPVALTSLADAIDPVGEEMSTQRLGPRSQAQYATADDWKKYRSEITKLYCDDNKILSEVQAVMRTRYGFNATVTMYKKRITKWQLRKNCKSAEKEAILRCMDTQKTLGVDLGQPMLHGKPVRMHLIDRHRKEKRKADDLAPADDHLSRQISSDCCHANKRKTLVLSTSVNGPSIHIRRARRVCPPSTTQASFSRVTAPTEYRNTQDLLVQVDHYVDAKLDWDPSASIQAWEKKSSSLPGGAVEISYTFENKSLRCKFRNDADLFERFRVAAICLENGQDRSAWKLMNEGAAMVHACLTQQGPEFLRRLSVYLALEDVRNYPEITNLLLRQFSAVAVTVLGQNHPVRNICRLLQYFPNNAEIAVLALQTSMDAFEHRLGSDHYICLHTMEKICRALIGQKKHNEAGRIMQQILKKNEQSRGQNDFESRWGLLVLAGFYHDVGKNDEAEEILTDIAKCGIENGRLDVVNVHANELRGLICMDRGDLQAAESLMWTALSYNVLRSGPQDPYTTQIWIHYKAIRGKQQQSHHTAYVHGGKPLVASIKLSEPIQCFSRPSSWSFSTGQDGVGDRNKELGLPTEQWFLAEVRKSQRMRMLYLRSIFPSLYY